MTTSAFGPNRIERVRHGTGKGARGKLGGWGGWTVKTERASFCTQVGIDSLRKATFIHAGAAVRGKCRNSSVQT